MTEKQKFKIIMSIEGDNEPEDDKIITKEVLAYDEILALSTAKNLVKTENPEINCMKIWNWAIEKCR